MFTWIFWKAIFERGTKTFVESWAAALVVNQLTPAEINWLDSLTVAGVATLIAVLLNIGISIKTDGGPSVGNVEKLSAS